MQTPGLLPSLALHWSSAEQGTQALLAQMGRAGSVQWALEEHETQRPAAQPRVEGLLAAHWLSPVQASHLLATQMGDAASMHWLSALHWTQRPEGSQTGVAPVQAPAPAA
jgi:hypothetical protein